MADHFSLLLSSEWFPFSDSGPWVMEGCTLTNPACDGSSWIIRAVSIRCTPFLLIRFHLGTCLLRYVAPAPAFYPWVVRRRYLPRARASASMGDKPYQGGATYLPRGPSGDASMLDLHPVQWEMPSPWIPGRCLPALGAEESKLDLEVLEVRAGEVRDTFQSSRRKHKTQVYIALLSNVA